MLFLNAVNAISIIYFLFGVVLASGYTLSFLAKKYLYGLRPPHKFRKFFPTFFLMAESYLVCVPVAFSQTKQKNKP